MILTGEPLDQPVSCDGLLLIGDPHLSSRRPGRRKDPDWPGPILRKLEACVALANARNLAPVLLGDLFERAHEPDEALKSRLVRLLKGFRIRPLANVGNHDMAHTTLSDGDTLAMLALSDVLDVAANSGVAARYAIGGRGLTLGMTPYGQEIPADASGLGGDVVWLTHHDLAFQHSYPGCVPPHAIEGCALAVNGHVHKAQRAVRAGSTLWENPGNISRISVDLIAQKPVVSVLDGSLRLTPEPLAHEADVFDLTGRLVEAASGAALTRDVESAFVSLLKAETGLDMAKSDDGSLLREEIEARFATESTPEPIRALVRSLLEDAVARKD